MITLKKFTPLYNMVSNDFFGSHAPSLHEIFNSDNYVQMPEIMAEDMEDVFHILNCNIPEKFGKFVRDLHDTDPAYEKYPRLHTSLSCGDILVDENNDYFFCAACGWTQCR